MRATKKLRDSFERVVMAKFPATMARNIWWDDQRKEYCPSSAWLAFEFFKHGIDYATPQRKDLVPNGENDV